ncbi:Epidermal growth factor-like protein 7 [Bulinus truncatus]|nr:Epidermal growth factor-like protein 7 [Bulinus truncatus]
MLQPSRYAYHKATIKIASLPWPPSRYVYQEATIKIRLPQGHWSRHAYHKSTLSRYAHHMATIKTRLPQAQQFIYLCLINACHGQVRQSVNPCHGQDRMTMGLIFFVTTVLYTRGSQSLETHGRHVCTQDREMAIPVPVRQSYTRGVYNAELNAITYQTAFRTVVKVQIRPQKTAGCCPGWEKLSPHDVSCNKPICQDGCANGGQCISPNVCMCPDGYTGFRCQIEINECDGRHKCQQMCVNTPGSYECACREGFKLSEDGLGCDLCLSCTKEFQEILYQMDSVAEVKQEMDDIQEMKTRAMKLEEFQKDIVELKDLKVKLTSLQDDKKILSSLDDIKSEMLILKQSQEIDALSVSELKNQIVELQRIQSEFGSIQELRKQVQELQELKSQIQSVQDFRSQIQSVQDLRLEIQSLQELRSQTASLLGMKPLVDTIPQLKLEVDELSILANQTPALERIQSQVDRLTLVKADVTQLQAINQSLQIMKPVVEEIPTVFIQVDRLLESAKHYDELRKELSKMNGRVDQLEEDKVV